MIDLRSDTVTKPTEEMRIAAANAVVGDDVYGDDPTVKELELRAAQILGMDAAMFVPSGTFGNQVSLLTHTNQGDEVILPFDAHLRFHEGGGAAIIASVMTQPIASTNGVMELSKVEAAIRDLDDIHYPKTSLIWLENAYGAGTVLPLDYLNDIRNLANKHKLKVHMDGARVFNAATHLGVDVKEITQYVDSIQVCLSKGLCAPVGSVVAGSKEFIEKARWYRKMMGGGLRQAGIIAAPALIAIEKMPSRLYVDHENAQYMAKHLNRIDGVEVMMDRLDINMVFFTIDEEIITSEKFVKQCMEHNILINGIELGEYRFVTNNDVSKDDIDYVIDVMNKILKK